MQCYLEYTYYMYFKRLGGFLLYIIIASNKKHAALSTDLIYYMIILDPNQNTPGVKKLRPRI